MNWETGRILKVTEARTRQKLDTKQEPKYTEPNKTQVDTEPNKTQVDMITLMRHVKCK